MHLSKGTGPPSAKAKCDAGTFKKLFGKVGDPGMECTVCHNNLAILQRGETTPLKGLGGKRCGSKSLWK